MKKKKRGNGREKESMRKTEGMRRKVKTASVR